jgi:hypothetical protein
MKDLLDLDKLLIIDNKNCVLLYFWGFKVTRGVDFQICGCEATFLLQGICAVKTRGKMNLLQWRGQAQYKKNGSYWFFKNKVLLGGFFAALSPMFLYLLYNLYEVGNP